MRGDPIFSPPTGGARQQQVNALMARGPMVPSGNALAKPPGMPMANMLAPPPPGEASPVSSILYANALGTAASAAPGMTVPGAGMPRSASQTSAQPPIATFPPAQSLRLSIGAHPADNMAHLRQAIGAMQISPAKLKAAAEGEDHVAQAAGALLQQERPITNADIDAAVKRASDGGKVDQQQAAKFAKSLPPTSDQGALRTALMLQRERSLRSLVVLHIEAQSRGIALSAAHRAPAGPSSIIPVLPAKAVA